MFLSGHDASDDHMKIVEEMKIAETGFESAPQAVMQLYLAFNLGNTHSSYFGNQIPFTGNIK